MPEIPQLSSGEAGIGALIPVASEDTLPLNSGAGEGSRQSHARYQVCRLIVASVPAVASRAWVATLTLIATQLGRRGDLPHPLQVQIIPGDVKLSNYGKSLHVKGKIAEKFMYYLQFY